MPDEKKNVCPKCGSSYFEKVKGNKIKCMFCGKTLPEKKKQQKEE